MPKRPELKPFDEQTRFIQILLEYMWRQRPPLHSAADLADHVQMSRQTVWQWLHKGVVPQPATLLLFVRRTTMTPAEARALFLAAGHGDVLGPPEEPSAEVLAQQILADAMAPAWLKAEATNLLSQVQALRNAMKEHEQSPGGADGRDAGNGSHLVLVAEPEAQRHESSPTRRQRHSESRAVYAPSTRVRSTYTTTTERAPTQRRVPARKGPKIPRQGSKSS